MAARPAGDRFRKGIGAVIFPRSMPYNECFRLAGNAGFEGMEPTMQLGDAALQAGVTRSAAGELPTRVGVTLRRAAIGFSPRVTTRKATWTF